MILKIDEFVPNFYQQALYDEFMSETNNNLWIFSSSASGVNKPLNIDNAPANIAKKQHGLSMIIYKDGNMYNPALFALISPLFYALKDYGVEINEVLRVRVVMFLSNDEGGIIYPHTDYKIPHNTLIYYINDSDGDTIFYKEKYDGGPEKSELSFDTSLTPQKGSAVIFDGLTYHSSSIPQVTNKRLLININFR